MAARALGLSNPKLWRKYNVSLRTSPVATKSITCMAAYIVGDLSAQLSSSHARRLEDKLAALDVARTARMALYGLLWCGPAGHKFYRWLDKSFMPGNPTAVAAVAGKVGIDQLLFAPLSTAVFFTWANLAACTPGRIAGDLSDKFVPSVRAAWALWVPAMTVNMAIVPPPMRILFINAMAIVWTNILSSMASSAPEATLERAEGLDFTQLAEHILADPLAAPVATATAEALAPQSSRAPRELLPTSTKSSKEPHASRAPRSTKDQGARSPRSSKDALAGAPCAQEGGRVVSPRSSLQSAADNGDSSFSWLLGLMRGPEDDESSRRNSFAESSHAAVGEDDVREVSAMHRVDTQALMDDIGDLSAFADLQDTETDNSVMTNELTPAL